MMSPGCYTRGVRGPPGCRRNVTGGGGAAVVLRAQEGSPTCGAGAPGGRRSIREGASGGGLRGGARPPRPIGLDHDEAIPLDASKKGGSKPASAATELSIVADFPYRYGGAGGEGPGRQGQRLGAH